MNPLHDQRDLCTSHTMYVGECSWMEWNGWKGSKVLVSSFLGHGTDEAEEEEHGENDDDHEGSEKVSLSFSLSPRQRTLHDPFNLLELWPDSRNGLIFRPTDK